VKEKHQRKTWGKRARDERESDTKYKKGKAEQRREVVIHHQA
jgi:hypothetical protein